MSIWHELAIIVERPLGWVLVVLAVFLLALVFVSLLWLITAGIAWLLRLAKLRITVTPTVRIDDELARLDRDARPYAHVNRVRCLTTPAPKGFSKRPLPFNPNLHPHCAATARPFEPVIERSPA